MTPEQAAQLSQVVGDVTWLKSRVGGSVASDDETLTRALEQVTPRVWNYSMSGSNGENDPDAVPTETGGERLRNIRRSTHNLKGRTERIESYTEPVTEPTTGLHGPAWAIGIFLGLIGVVEVARLILDVIVS